MSANTSLAVFQFADGKCRVGIVQAVENFFKFDWLTAARSSSERDVQMSKLPRRRNMKSALHLAGTLFLERHEDIEHGVEVIKLDCNSSPEVDSSTGEKSPKGK